MYIISPTTREARASQRGLPPLTDAKIRSAAARHGMGSLHGTLYGQ